MKVRNTGTLLMTILKLLNPLTLSRKKLKFLLLQSYKSQMILYSQFFFYHDPLPNIISIQLILQFNYTLFIMRARGFTFVTCSPIPTALIPFCFMGRELWSAFAPLFLLCFSFIILSSIYYIFSWPTSFPRFFTLLTFRTIFSFFSLLPPPGYTLFHLLTVLFSLMDLQPYKPRLLCRSLHFHRFYIRLYCYVY